MKPAIQRTARLLLWLEPLVLALILLAFWYPTPTRTDWLWTLLLLLPIWAARFYLHGRLLTRTPLDGLFLAFLLLGAINVYVAPYTRGLMMMARPLLGMAICYALVERARREGSLRGPNTVLVLLALLVGILALGSTQWNAKAGALQAVIDALPTIQGFPGAEGGFNANEIAGALAWLTPVVAGLMIWHWREKLRRWDVTLAFVLLFAALVLGQSRSAILSVLVCLALMIPLLIPRGGWRVAAWVGLVVVLGLQATVMFDFIELDRQRIEEAVERSPAETDIPPAAVERTTSVRLDIWGSALAILRDYPLTGVGLSMFRDGRVRDAYPVPSYSDSILPHVHNEYLQVGADMGVPGLLVFVGMYAVAGWMALQIWRQGDAAAMAQAVAVAGGLLAHALYGIADTITLWDRFAFIFWLLLGLLAAQYSILQRDPS